MSLQIPNCVQVGVVSHEFMHTLGFVHEQSRLDRDNYVTIMWPNISRGNFKVCRGWHCGKGIKALTVFLHRFSKQKIHFSNRSVEKL